MSQLHREDDFVYSRPMLAVMMLRRLLRRMSQRHRKVNMKFDLGLMPSPENQHIDGHKWEYFITLSLNGCVPPIGWDQMPAFNQLLLMTETDRLLVGVTFVTIFTDTPWNYQREELARAVCRAFGLELNELTDASEDELSKY